MTRNRAVLDDADHALDHALDPVASAAASMNMLAVSDQEAADLRFGRRIAHDIRTTTAAYVEETNDLVAILDVRNAVRLNRSRYSTEPSNQTTDTNSYTRRT